MYNTKFQTHDCYINHVVCLLEQLHRCVAQSRDMSKSYFFCHTYEEQSINFELEIINLTNLDDKSEHSQCLTYSL